MKSQINALSKISSKQGVLCFSRLLLKAVGSECPLLRKAVEVCEQACLANSLSLLESEWLDEALVLDQKLGTTLAALKWLLANQLRLKFEGMTSIAIVSMPDCQRRQVNEIVKILKKIRASGTLLYLFDIEQQLIDIGSMDDVISSDDHLKIWVNSLVYDTWIDGISMQSSVTAKAFSG